MGSKECDYTILCLDEDFKCDGIACLKKRVRKEGLANVASKILNIDISITRTKATTKGDCGHPKDSK